jgi:hypothetical protein
MIIRHLRRFRQWSGSNDAPPRIPLPSVVSRLSFFVCQLVLARHGGLVEGTLTDYTPSQCCTREYLRLTQSSKVRLPV